MNKMVKLTYMFVLKYNINQFWADPLNSSPGNLISAQLKSETYGLYLSAVVEFMNQYRKSDIFER